MWFYCYCSNYASNVLLPLSAFLLPFLHESPQGMVMFPRTANTPGDNSELRNLDSTPDVASQEPRGHEKANSPRLVSVSSSTQ